VLQEIESGNDDLGLYREREREALCDYYYYYYHHHRCLLYAGYHTHIPETNRVARVYIVAAILSLLFMVYLFLVPALALLFFYVSTFRSMCAVPSMAVFCSSLTSFYYYHYEIMCSAQLTFRASFKARNL
jgi:hypothetical protein